MTDTGPTTVAVPVDLLKRAVQEMYQGVPVKDELEALIPKPKPRLVAVPDNFRDWHDQPNQTSEEYLTAQPDLLTLLDEAIDGPLDYVTPWRDIIKARIRTALGVTE